MLLAAAPLWALVGLPAEAGARKICLDVPDAIFGFDWGDALQSPWAALGLALAALWLLPRIIKVTVRWLLLPAIVASLAYIALEYPEAAAQALQAALLFTKAHPVLVSAAIFAAAAILLGPEILVAAAVFGAAALLAGQAGILQLPEVNLPSPASLAGSAMRAPAQLAGQLERRLEAAVLPAPQPTARPAPDAERQQAPERKRRRDEDVLAEREAALESKAEAEKAVREVEAIVAPDSGGNSGGIDGGSIPEVDIGERAKQVAVKLLKSGGEQAGQLGALARDEASKLGRAGGRILDDALVEAAGIDVDNSAALEGGRGEFRKRAAGELLRRAREQASRLGKTGGEALKEAAGEARDAAGRAARAAARKGGEALQEMERRLVDQ